METVFQMKNMKSSSFSKARLEDFFIELLQVALNPDYQVPELEYTMNKVGVKCLVCPDKVKKTNYYKMLNELIPGLESSEVGKLNSSLLPSLKSVITISDEALK